MLNPWIRQGFEQGIKQGREQVIFLSLSKRFANQVTNQVKKTVEAMTDEEQYLLIDRLLDPSNTLQDLGLVDGALHH